MKNFVACLALVTAAVATNGTEAEAGDYGLGYGYGFQPVAQSQLLVDDCHLGYGFDQVYAPPVVVRPIVRPRIQVIKQVIVPRPIIVRPRCHTGYCGW